MFKTVCSTITASKWSLLSSDVSAINSVSITSADCLTDSIKNFFCCEVKYFCRDVLQELINQGRVPADFLDSSEAEQIVNLLYDFVLFSSDEAKQLLEFAIETEVFFLINPAKCLSEFLFKINKSTENEVEMKSIDKIISELGFFIDKQEVISLIREELLEVANTKHLLSKKEFSDLASDVVFNYHQKLDVLEFMLPVLSFIQLNDHNEEIPVEFVEMFLVERDLGGIFNQINDTLIEEQKTTITYDELYNKLDLFIHSFNSDNTSVLQDINVELTEENSNIGADDIDNTSINVELLDEDGDLDIASSDASTDSLEDNIALIENIVEQMIDAVPGPNENDVEQPVIGVDTVPTDDFVNTEIDEQLDVPEVVLTVSDEGFEEIDSAIDSDNDEILVGDLPNDLSNDSSEPVSDFEQKHNNFYDVITTMRTEGVSAFEIENKYLELEKNNIEDISRRILG